MDSSKGLALGVGTELSGISASMFYSRAEMAGIMTEKAHTKNATPADANAGLQNEDVFDDGVGDGAYGGPGDDLRDTHTAKRTGLGVKASMSAGEGATITIGYSTVKTQRSNHVNGVDVVAVAAVEAVEATATTPAVTAADAEVEVAGTDDNWSLVDEKTKLIELDFSYDLGGGATLNAGIDQKAVGEKKTTTLEATIAMSF